MIFSAPMIQALLAGRKTQTRRLLKPQPPSWATFCQQPSMFNVFHQWVPSGLWSWSEPEQSPPRALRRWPIDADGDHYWLRLPFGKGDRLWVKENWRTSIGIDRVRPSKMEIPGGGYGWPIWYEADAGAVTWRGATNGGPGFINPGKLRPSIFMPRWGSRLTLVVTDVRVERLNAIGEEDAAAEGLIRLRSGRYAVHQGEQYAGLARHTARARFADLWAEIHGPDAWAANPWVAAITFDVRCANIDSAPPADPVAPAASDLTSVA